MAEYDYYWLLDIYLRDSNPDPCWDMGPLELYFYIISAYDGNCTVKQES